MSDYKMFHPNMGPYKRSVSIIGTGCTPFQNMLESPDWSGITENELFACAAIEAMDDAGIVGKDIDAFIQSQVFPGLTKQMNGNVFCADWIGMRGKPSWHIESACTSSALVFDSAVMAVASGRYDVVLAGGVDMAYSQPDGKKPSCYRRPTTSAEMAEYLLRWADPAYARYIGAGNMYVTEDTAEPYMAKYGVTPEELDDAFIGLAISSRRSAALEPNALFQKEYKDLAKAAGYDDVIKYMKSNHNPKITNYHRKSGFYNTTDGAAAVIVCATDILDKLKVKGKPIEVLGIGFCSLDHRHPQVVSRCNDEAARQVYELTGVKPEEIDLLLTPDFTAEEVLDTAEAAGYLPKGEGWKYLRDQRTAYDGDKPINTEGGCANFGHVFGASTLSKLHEAVHQMRGECGARQVKKLPKTSLVRGQGGAQSALMTILRTLE